LELSIAFRKIGAQLTVWLLILWCALWIASSWLRLLSLPAMGVFTLILSALCIRYDRALWTKTGEGRLHAFLRSSLATGYAWLLLSAAFMMASGVLPGAIVKDVLFHSMGLGFIFTMILAHAPLILPAAFGKLPPSSAPEITFQVFQVTTVLRIVADLLVSASVQIWMWTGWITGVLHIGLFLTYVALVASSIRKT
jgi:hypothetical protein